MLNIKSIKPTKKKFLFLFDKIFVLALFIFIPLQFCSRYFDFYEIQNLLRVYVLLFISYLFVTSKNQLSILLSFTVLIFFLLNYFRLNSDFIVYTLAGIIAYSSFMIFSINRSQILNIIKNEKFILIVISLSCINLLISGSLASFYWNDVQRFTYPRLFEDYPLSNPNTVALFQVLCLYFILVLLIKKNQSLSNNSIIFCYIFSFFSFYTLLMTLSRQACIVMVIIQVMFLLDAFIQKNKFSLKSLFFITFIISIIITIYVFISRGDFIEQQFEGRISSMSSYSMNFNGESIINSENILNKFEIFNIIIGKIFGMSTNSIVYIINFVSSKDLMYLPSADSLFLSSINNGGIFLTSIIIFLFIQVILPHKFDFLSTSKMFCHLFIIIILSFGHVFNENFVAFIIFFLTLLIRKKIYN